MNNPKVTSRSQTIATRGQSALSLFLQLRTVYPQAFFYQASEFGSFRAYAIIGLSAEEAIRVRGGKVEVISQTTRTLGGEPTTAVAEYIDSIGFPEASDVPFSAGGLFGVFGYDYIQHLETTLKKSGYFASAPAGNTIEAELHLCLRLVVLDLCENTARIVSGNRLGDLELIQADLRQISELVVSCEEQKFEVTPKGETDVDPNALNERLQASMGQSKYFKNVQILKEHIRNGNIFQAVLAETFVGPRQASPIAIFKALYQKSTSPFHLFMGLFESTLIGASPEALVRVQGEHIETHPIAGTRPRGVTVQDDLKHERNLKRSPKEQAEHLMLVDLARNDFGRVSVPGSVQVENYAELKKFSHVMHLCSRVTGKLDLSRFNALDVFSACFPVGTVSGAPKVRAMKILAELETVPRGFYGGGFLAMDSHGFLDSSLLIRTLEVVNEKIILRAGAGIVADSSPEREYQEIQNKLRGLKQAVLEAEREEEIL